MDTPETKSLDHENDTNGREDEAAASQKPEASATQADVGEQEEDPLPEKEQDFPSEEEDMLPKQDNATDQEDEPRTRKSASRARTTASLVLTVIVVVLLAATVPLFWAKATLLDTDQWVAAVAPLADSPEIQKVVADTVSAKIIEALDVQSIAEQNLPDRAQLLASPIASSIESMIRQQTESLVASTTFSNLLSTINRNGHRAIVAAFTTVDNSSALSNTNGTVTLDVGIVVEAVQQGLVDRGFGFAANIPTSFLSGEVVLFSSPLLAQAQSSFSVMQATANVLAIGMLVLLIVALLLTGNRRKVILWLGMGVFIALLLSVLVIEFAKAPLIDSLAGLTAVQKAALFAAYDTLLSSLLFEQKVIAVVGLVVGILALVAGNRAVRTKADELLLSISAKKGIGAFCRWVDAHKKGVFAAGFIVVGLVLLLQSSLSWVSLINAAIVLIVWVIIVSVVLYLASLNKRMA